MRKFSYILPLKELGVRSADLLPRFADLPRFHLTHVNILIKRKTKWFFFKGSVKGI